MTRSYAIAMTFLIPRIIQHQCWVALVCLATVAMPEEASVLVDGSFSSPLVPKEIEYYALLPPNYTDEHVEFPLVSNLHGGGGSREILKRQQTRLAELWREGTLRSMVVVSPSVAPRSFYMDFNNGSQMWETLLVGPFPTHLQEAFNVRTHRRGTMVTGISMGGMGALRMAFKHSDVFGAVAALEPGIEPIDDWADIRPKHRFWRADALLDSIYGEPVDREYWNSNNPATIAMRNGEALRKSGLKIFIEAGDTDLFWLYEGTEFLHQVLWKEKIRHEYRLYYDEDHVGRSIGPRTEAAFQFLSNSLVDKEIDPVVESVRRRIDPLKRRLNEADHYEVDIDLIGPQESTQ